VPEAQGSSTKEHFLPFERWVIDSLTQRDEHSAFHGIRKDLVARGGERSWRLFAASVFWFCACPCIMLAWIFFAIVLDLPVGIGIIAGGVLFLIGLARGFQSHFVSRTYQSRTEPR
jgi:hypothetical protein